MSLLTHVDVPEGKHVLVITDKTGHTTKTYDPTSPEEIAAIKEEFDHLVGGLRMTAFTQDRPGGDTMTREFDETAPATVLIPQMQGG